MNGWIGSHASSKTDQEEKEEDPLVDAGKYAFICKIGCPILK